MEKRKSVKAKTEVLTLHLPVDLLKEVDKLAMTKFEGNRQMAIRQLIRLGLTQAPSD